MRSSRVTFAFVTFALLLSTFPASTTASPRIYTLEHRAGARDTTRLVGEGSALRFTTDGTRLVATEAFDPGAPERWIVSFPEPRPDAAPAERVRARGELAAGFERTLARSVPRQFGLAGPTGVRVLRSFDRLIAASVVEAPAGWDGRLRALPGVRAVARDVRVRADLAQSVHQVRADLVQQQLGGSGRGVRVGIIDTGIDYTHPALGGGFGPGFRVAGGWDFVHGDADPRDDNGHGTHVAGIVGGEGGGIHGMAPQVTFYAYKVLGAEGIGVMSDVIAALERCADPDQDPATDDALDVVNLSLGGSASEADDPAVAAVDALDAAGTTVVVAAGNFGSTFGVSSPGIAAAAITVGAVNKQDTLSVFSSRGPTLRLGIKPDLVAPGEDITSAWLGGGTNTLSGTSMATPHVTGAVALLRQLHPDWSHAELRAAVIGSATDVHRLINEQGAGRLDAFAAATATLFVSPTSLAFGRVSPRVQDWVQAETLHVHSRAFAATGASLSLRTAHLPAGVEAVLSPTQVLLPPGGEALAVLTLHLSAGRAPNLEPPFIVEGVVEVRDGFELRRVPFSVHECLRLALTTNGRSLFGVVLDGQRAWPSAGVFGSSWFLPVGTYDALAFSNRYIDAPFVGEIGIRVEADTAVDLPSASNTATVSLDLRDEQGHAHRPGRLALMLLHETGAGLGIFGMRTPASLQLPPVSSHYHLEWAADDPDGDVRYDIPGSLGGPLGTHVVTNDPAALHRVVEHVRVTPPDSLLSEEFRLFAVGADGYGGGASLDPFAVPRGASYDITRWSAATPFRRHVRYGRTTWLAHAANARSGEGELYAGVGPVWEMDRGDTTNVLPWLRPGGSLLELTGHDQPFGTGPGSFSGGLQIYAGMLSIFPGEYSSSRLFADAVGSLTAGEPTAFELVRDGQPFESGTIPNESHFLSASESWSRALPAGAWELTLRSPGWSVAGAPSVTTVRTNFRSDGDAVYLAAPQLFTVLAGGSPAEEITFGQSRDPRVQLLLGYVAPGTSVSLAYRPVAGNAAWTPLVVEHDGLRYRAKLAECEGDIALRATIASLPATAAPLVMEVSPAFRAHRSPAGGAVVLTALADGTGAHIAWHVAAPGATLIVERARPGGAWDEWGETRVGNDGVARFDDAALETGKTYGYRLSGSTSPVWLHVPAAGAALALSVSPDPSPRDILASVTVDRAAPLTLSLYDVQGRMVSTRRLDTLAPGQHVINLTGSSRARPGLYFVRLVRGADVLTRRITIIP